MNKITASPEGKPRAGSSIFRSIRGMLILLLMVVLVPIIVVQLFVYKDRLNTAEKIQLRSNIEIARATSKAFESFIQNILLQEKGIAIALTSFYALNPSVVQPFLDDVEKLYPDFQRILIISPAGHVIASSNRAPIGFDVTDRSYFREVMSGKEWSVSELIRAKADDRAVFVVSSPVRDKSRELIGIIAVAVDDQRLKELFDFTRFGGELTILDNTGRAVYRHPMEPPLDWNARDFTKIDPRVSEALSGKEVSDISTNSIDGKKRIYGMSPITSIGWVSRASIKETEAMHEVYHQIYRNAAFFFFVVIGSIFAAVFFSRRISDPIQKLKFHALSLQRGEWSHPIVLNGPDEIEDFAATFNSMTGEIRMREEGLRKTRDELDLKVQERTADLERSNEELKRLNKEMQEFVFVASHDLQEPVRKIQMFSDLLKSESLTEEKRSDYFERMQFAAERMRTMIKGLLTYSRITTKGEAFTRVNLAESARKALRILDLMVEETGAKVAIGDLPDVEADPSQMVQLFQNLLENALKFRQKDRASEVKIYSEQTVNSHARIMVEDNGIGFDENHLDRIFVPFERLHGMGDFKGTGIGLAICHKIVERHGGKVTAKSSPGKGSTFIIDLPVKQIRPE